MKLIYNRTPAIQGQLEYSQRLRAPNVDIGQDIARLGQGAAQLGGSIAQVDDEWDKAAVADAELSLLQARKARAAELEQAKGFDSVGAGMKLKSSFSEDVQKIKGGLKNERQRALLEDIASREMVGFNDFADQYSVAEGQKAHASRHESLKTLLIERAAAAAAVNDTRSIAEASKGLLDQLRTGYRAPGAGEVEREAEQLATMTRLHSAVLGSVLAKENPTSGDVTFAERYLAAYGDEMEAGTRAKLQQDVEQFGLKGWALRTSDDIQQRLTKQEAGRPPLFDAVGALAAVREEKDPTKRDLLRARVLGAIQDNSVIQREHDEPRVAQVGLDIDKGAYRSWTTVEGLSQYREASDVGRQRIRNLWDQYLDKLRMSSDRARAKQGEKDNAAMLYYHSLPPEERAKLKVTLDPTGRRAIITGEGSEVFDGTSDQGTLLLAKEAKRLSAGPLVGEAEARSRLSTFAMAAENAHHFKADARTSETEVRQKFIGYVMSQWNAYRSARPQTDDLPSEAQFMEWQSKALEEMKKEGWVWDSTKPRYLMEAEDFGEYLPPGDTQDAQTVDVQERVRADTAPVATPTGPIRMRFPDGTIRPVTPEKVDRATSLGAVRVE